MYPILAVLILSVPVQDHARDLANDFDFGPTYGKAYSGSAFRIFYWSSSKAQSADRYREVAVMCQEKCENNVNCFVWTYIPPSDDHSAPERCVLKSVTSKSFPSQTESASWTGAATRAARWHSELSGMSGDFLMPAVHYSPDCLSISGWHDIAGAISLVGDDDQLIHHVFQGCPVSGGWHHGYSSDLVHWSEPDQPISPAAIHETYRGMDSFDSPCSGFVVVDDDGRVCAGFRQCSSNRGLSHAWDVPLELRCATDNTLTQWNDPDYIFEFYFERALPYDPVRPWKGNDGLWYATIAADSCNGTGWCVGGSAQFLYSSPRLHGDGAQWNLLGIMFASNRTVMSHGQSGGDRHNEFVTPDFFGGIPGDPLHGTTKVMLDNGYGGYTMYFTGYQDDGQEFRADFSRTGAIDYASFSPVLDSGGQGINAVTDGQPMVFGMSRTFGARDPNHVAVNGRRVLAGWLQGNIAFMSLPRDLSLDSNGNLLQQFVPELKSIRIADSYINSNVTVNQPFNISQQFEVVLSVSQFTQSNFGLQVLLSGDANEYTAITINTTANIVIVNATLQGNAVPRAGPFEMPTDGTFHLHAIVDHSIVTLILNNRTALTVFTSPSDALAVGVSLFGLSDAVGSVEFWNLESPNSK